MKCRIIITDDHKIFRSGLKSLIERDKDMRVVAQAEDGEDLFLKLRDKECDVVILDLLMPKMDGIAALKLIKQDFPKVRPLVLTMQKDREHFRHAMAHGALGFVLKEDAYEQLLKAIEHVMKNKEFVSPSVKAFLDEGPVRPPDDVGSPCLEILTPREQEVLKLIAAGMANKNIAARLKISIRTVEAHRCNLSNKLGIKTTAGLVKYALAKQL